MTRNLERERKGQSKTSRWARRRRQRRLGWGLWVQQRSKRSSFKSLQQPSCVKPPPVSKRQRLIWLWPWPRRGGWSRRRTELLSQPRLRRARMCPWWAAKTIMRKAACPLLLERPRLYRHRRLLPLRTKARGMSWRLTRYSHLLHRTRPSPKLPLFNHRPLPLYSTPRHNLRLSSPPLLYLRHPLPQSHPISCFRLQMSPRPTRRVTLYLPRRMRRHHHLSSHPKWKRMPNHRHSLSRS